MSLVSKNSCSGYTLLEVMISMLVLSIGMLGLASLLVNGLKSSQSALHRSQASLYAYEIMDVMRANRELALAGDYAVSSTATGSSLATATLPNQEIYYWKQNLKSLPSGAGSISASGAAVTVSVFWDESRMSNGSIESFSFAGEL